MAWLSIIFAAIPAVIYLVAGLPVTAGTVSIGTLIAFTTLQNGLFRPVACLLSTSVSVISSLALFARISNTSTCPSRSTSRPARSASTWPRSPATSVWTMSALPTPGADRPAVTGIDLDIPAGSRLAVVGETESGRTTLGSLLARLYDESSDTVFI